MASMILWYDIETRDSGCIGGVSERMDLRVVTGRVMPGRHDPTGVRQWALGPQSDTTISHGLARYDTAWQGARAGA